VANFAVVNFKTDEGPLAAVLAAFNDTKTLHLVDIERLSINGYRGTVIHDT